jgi:hypothetical protein
VVLGHERDAREELLFDALDRIEDPGRVVRSRRPRDVARGLRDAVAVTERLVACGRAVLRRVLHDLERIGARRSEPCLRCLERLLRAVVILPAIDPFLEDELAHHHDGGAHEHVLRNALEGGGPVRCSEALDGIATESEQSVELRGERGAIHG